MMASEVLTCKGVFTEGRRLPYTSTTPLLTVARFGLSCCLPVFDGVLPQGFALLDIYLLMNVITTTSTFPLLAGGLAYSSDSHHTCPLLFSLLAT